MCKTQSMTNGINRILLTSFCEAVMDKCSCLPGRSEIFIRSSSFELLDIPVQEAAFDQNSSELYFVL